MKKLALALLPLLVACGDPFAASIQAKKVCVRQLNQTVRGAGPAALALDGAAPEDRIIDTIEITTEDLAEFQGKNEFDAELGLQSFKFTAPGGTKITTLSVVLRPPPGSDPNLKPLTLIQYPALPGQEGLVNWNESTNEFTGDLSGHNLMDYISEDNLSLDLTAEGNIPASDWNADVEVCASAEAEYDYSKEIGL
jgi:hypothetical protein